MIVDVYVDKAKPDSEGNIYTIHDDNVFIQKKVIFELGERHGLTKKESESMTLGVLQHQRFEINGTEYIWREKVRTLSVFRVLS